MQESPIQNLGSIDIVGKKNDGTVDLCIVVSSYLNESAEHEDLLRQKVQVYIQEIFSENWQQQYGNGNSNILIKSVVMPHQNIINLIGALKKYLADFNVGISLEIV